MNEYTNGAVAEPVNRVSGKGKKKPAPTEINLRIKPIRLGTLSCEVVGTAPLVVNRFSNKAQQQIAKTQAEGAQAKGKKLREPKDFQQCFLNAQYYLPDGRPGVPCMTFKHAIVTACSTQSFFKSHMKLAVPFIEADGFDVTDNTPLVAVTAVKDNEPFLHMGPVRNSGMNATVDLRARPMWSPGWRIGLRIRFDADMLSVNDLINLLVRAGLQCGIMEGRPSSTRSCGMSWGLFEVDTESVGVDMPEVEG